MVFAGVNRLGGRRSGWELVRALDMEGFCDPSGVGWDFCRAIRGCGSLGARSTPGYRL